MTKVPDGRVQHIESNGVMVANLLYPNPSSASVKLAQEYAGKFQTATLASMEGKVVGNYSIQDDTITFDNVQPGLYVVRLYGRTQMVVTKLVLRK